jgi:hypothetical protein
MSAKIINFRKKAVLLNHRRKQEEIVSKIIKANLEIEKKLLDWQKQSNKKIGRDIEYEDLPKDIRELLNQLQANDHILLNKYKIYIDYKI